MLVYMSVLKIDFFLSA